MKYINDIPYAAFAECRLDLYLPNNDVFPVMIFFHGGGLESGDKQLESDVFQSMAASGIAVVSAEYRMYPSAKYPDFIEDSAAAVAWTTKNINRYGRCEKVYVAGSSAGAYLSMMLCFDKKYLGKHSIDSDIISGYIFDSAQPTTHFNVLHERGMDTRKVIIDEAAPIYHITANPAAAPMLILVSDHDIPNRLEQTNLFCSTLKQFGYKDEKVAYRLMKGYEHTEYVHSKDNEGNNIFVEIIKEFIMKT